MISPSSWDNLYFDNEGGQEVKAEWQKVAASLEEADRSKASELEMYRISRNFFKLLTASEHRSVSLWNSELRNSLIRNMNEFISPRKYCDLHDCIINIQLMNAFYEENQQAFKQLSLGEPTARITRSESRREALVSVTALRDALNKSAMPHQPESKQYSSTNIRWYEENTGQRLVLDESNKPWEPG
ncbi:hypothetical protein [Endozoicomonas atrinae]|uniref:hypothetical protein n=1 Tax=Endozoicomonas atrinae TaxID=1333660 RepID=UPI000826C8BB|nr:hypothetical protein [Endozoicomonas atrinae]